MTDVRVTCKLFATLRDYLPDELGGHVRSGNEIAVEIPEGTPVQAMIDRFHMPSGLVHLVLVNGAYVPPERRSDHVLHDGDAVAVWPPVAGG